MTDSAPCSDRVGQIANSAIHEMTRLSASIPDVAFLSWAKPTVDTPAHIREAAIRAIQDGVTGGYTATTGLPALREAIIDKLQRDNGIAADVPEVMVTVGAVEGLSAAVMATVDPGDEVILPVPTYSTHIRMVQLASAKPVLVPCSEEQDYALDLDAIEAAITPRTRAFIYCSPCNPTGAVYDEDQLRRLADIALRHRITVITDEAYEYFVFDDRRHFAIGSIPEMRHLAVSCFTFTKTYAMTGWRIGYLHADRELIPQITKAHIPFSICAPTVSQHAALAALQGPRDCVDAFSQHYQEARDVMCERLDRLPGAFSYRRPAGSYLMFPRIDVEGVRDSTAFCLDLLQRAHVSTTPGVAFGPNGEGHCRMSFCVPLDTIHQAFDRIERYLEP